MWSSCLSNSSGLATTDASSGGSSAMVGSEGRMAYMIGGTVLTGEA